MSAQFLAREPALANPSRGGRYQPFTRTTPRRPASPTWRPAARPPSALPSPIKPFGAPARRAAARFGKKAALELAEPIARRSAMQLARYGAMAVPFLDVAAGAWTAYDLWRDLRAAAPGGIGLNYDPEAAGFRVVFSHPELDVGSGITVIRLDTSPAGYDPSWWGVFPYHAFFDGLELLGGQPPNGTLGDNVSIDHTPLGPYSLRWQALFTGPGHAGDRMQYANAYVRWQFYADGRADPREMNEPLPDWPVEYEMPPLPVLDPLPYPYPFAPEPYPVQPPLRGPMHDPGVGPSAPPVSSPSPVGNPGLPRWMQPRAASPRLRDQPVHEWRGDPGSGKASAGSGFHANEPPGPRDRERKRRGAHLAWAGMNLLGHASEVNDTVKAVYKALPWKLTRWKGRDGKWRDRDLGPLAKAKRIYDNLDQLNVGMAIMNLAQNQLTDELIGRLSARGPSDSFGLSIGAKTGRIQKMLPNL